MGRQTWNHVHETGPFRGHGHAGNGAQVGARSPSDRIRIRRTTRAANPLMPRKDTLVAFALGIALLALAGALAVAASSTAGQLVRTPGTVVRIVQDSDAMRAYRPIVAYLANGGRRREVAGNTASSVPAYDIGESVDVLLDPADPERPARVDDFAQRWLPAAVPALLAVVSLSIGGLLYVNERRNHRFDALPHRATGKPVRRRWNIAAVLIPIAIGTGFLTGAGAAGLRQWQIAHRYAHSIGHVVEVAGTARSSLHSAIVTFTTDSGRPITFTQGPASSSLGLHEGDAVNVLYDPVTPEHAIVDPFWDRWRVAGILFAIGAPLFVAGLFVAARLWPEHRLHDVIE
ncbi:DUF3592 domain-containing protein [Burkholderia sp. IMCC1007]|uniref:DUF3592 domain-containing protein n=1 Tax=Burkholderia sp. IMCC1007 TaxID=3004104 RepID=UPI0022B2DC9A|nr:DUF3592 domain-containing protein [Burkholderia sp. IMCC1007]